MSASDVELEEPTPPGGRALAVPLVIAAVLVAVAVAGSAYGARRTEDGALEIAQRTTTTRTEEPTVQGPPKAQPVKAGASLTGETPCPKPSGNTRTDSFEKEPPMCIDPTKQYKAIFKTNIGVIEATLDKASKATNSFVVLARYKYYDGTALWQTIPGIDVVVGGNPKTQDASDPGAGYTITDRPAGVVEDPTTGELTGGFTYTEGVLGLAPVAEPFQGGASFFMAGGPNVNQLDQAGVYLRFGMITKGLDLVKKVLLTHTPCDPADQQCVSGGPDPLVIVQTVTIEES